MTDEEFERAFPIEEDPFNNATIFLKNLNVSNKGNNMHSMQIPSLGQMYGQIMTPINRVSDYMSRYNNLRGYTLPENSTDYSGNMLDSYTIPDDWYSQYNDGRTPAGPPDPETTDPGPDYLGWGQVLTGGLQGISGILDYFNKKAGLKLTEDAINKKYAHADREWLGRATTADNILAGRKHFIEKTHADPDSSHLQYINRSNA